ncbi:39S ribosomal protein L9, mitochondrial-like [Mercenaria mercenaria]|uniref:39S ribosomal protein L9, mitochondrial-like n=1 Tax=Mercenaria mercenaria TaxID=6596 RepID=UPI00234F5BEB|nr:39S ribosomal protein L9, mitochondrial-like [Mercenaria mercenaria]
MLASLRQSCQCTCRCFLQNRTPGLVFTAVRKYEHPETAVFERMHKVNNVGVGKYPLLRRRHYILNKVHPSEQASYKKTMKCILTKEIDGIGLKGTVVEVPKRLFRNQLYPSGEAVYASPENIDLYEQYRKESEEEGIDYEIKQLMRKMAGFHLRVFMNGKESWTLGPNHLKVAFRKMGVMLGEDNIIMPDKGVQNMGDFTFRLQMNERIACQVCGTVYPVGEDGLPQSDVEYPPIWDNPLIDPSTPTEYLKKKADNVEDTESISEKNVEDVEESTENEDSDKT